MDLELTSQTGEMASFSGSVPGSDSQLDVFNAVVYLGEPPEEEDGGDEDEVLDGSGIEGCIVQLRGAVREREYWDIALQGDAVTGMGIHRCTLIG